MSSKGNDRLSVPRGQMPRVDPSHGRNLVLVFDGTGNTYDSNLTSLPVLFSLLCEDPSKQLCYYQSGVGTFSSRWTPSGLMKGLSKLIDEGIAWDLGDHVKSGYNFLMDQYQIGDKIFLFGFSRGAHTARALAGMVQQVGLLPAGNDESISLAYHIYSRKQGKRIAPQGETMAEGFKRSFSRSVQVHFVGVWDTVSSVGAIFPRHLPFAAGSTFISVFRHAYSLDERRARFSPIYWSGPRFSSATPDASDVKEVAFSGAHSDVGGGRYSTDGDVNPRLSHLSLRWMIREAFVNGIQLDEEAVINSALYGGNKTITTAVQAAINSKSAAMDEYLSPALNPHGASAQLVGLVQLGSRDSSAYFAKDSVSGRGDSLSFLIQQKAGLSTFGKITAWPARAFMRIKTAMWWILEVSPTLKLYWDDEGKTTHYILLPNMGRPRNLPSATPIIFHESVRSRMDAKAYGPGDGLNVPESKVYEFKAKFPKGVELKDVVYEA